MRLICSVRTPPPHAMRACILFLLRTRFIVFLRTRCAFCVAFTPRKRVAFAPRVAPRLRRVCAALRTVVRFAPRLPRVAPRCAALRIPGDPPRGTLYAPMGPYMLSWNPLDDGFYNLEDDFHNLEDDFHSRIVMRFALRCVEVFAHFVVRFALNVEMTYFRNLRSLKFLEPLATDCMCVSWATSPH